MDEFNFTIGNIFEIEPDRFRLISTYKDYAYLILMDVTKIKIYTKSLVDLYEMINSGECKVIPYQEDFTYFDESQMTENVLKFYKLKKKVVLETINHFNPRFDTVLTKQGSLYAKELCDREGLAVKLFWISYRRYLQEGFNDNAFIDSRLKRKDREPLNYKNRTGKKSSLDNGSKVIIGEAEIKYFEEALKDYLSGRYRSIQEAYNNMVLKHYKVIKEIENGVSVSIASQDKLPSFWQMKYYFNKHLDKERKDIAKTSKQEQRNNQRLLLSDNLKGVTGPGSLWEVDECEMDLFLVSEDNPSIVVGRPIVYAMIDIYTRLIIAYSVSFENNSIKGITNCFMSLLDDKSEVCKKFGINPENVFWPSKVLPQRLRSDYGSEYISYEMERICNELGIQHELASPATGSLKGQVEQLFRQFHSSQNGVLENYGLIEKCHDSKHKKNATLNIKEFESLLVGTIITHNKKIMKDYPRRRDMINKKVLARPEDLWIYGVEKYGSPRVITNETLFKWTMLTPIKATLSRKGVYYKGLYYMDYNDDELRKELLSLGTKTSKEEMKIDPRSINQIYRLSDNQIKTLTLNENKTGNLDYKDMDLNSYLLIYNQLTKDKLEATITNNELSIGKLDRDKAILENAKGKNTVHSSKNLKENRAIEKQKIAEKQLIIKNDDSTKEQTIKNDNRICLEDIPDDMLEAIRMFEEEEYGY